MKTKIAIIILVTLFLTACSPQPAPVAQVEQPSSTPLQSTSTATNTPMPTDTPVPTDTPQPTATFTPTATPVPETISLANAGSLQLVRRYGNGRMVQTMWSTDTSRLLVLTTVHLKAFEPVDGKLLWEVETGSPQTQMVNSEDGKSIITISADGAVKIWDAASGQPVKTVFEPRDGIDISSISSTGDFLALTSSSKETTIWDVHTGGKLISNDGSSVPMGMIGTLLSSENSVFWTNGFGSGHTQQIQGWDGSTGKFYRGLKGTSQLYVTELAVSPDSTMIAGISRLALTSQPQFSFLIWEAETGNLLTRVDFTEDIQAYTFIAGQDKALIASGSGVILPVVLSTGEVGEKFGLYKSVVISMAASPDGKMLGVAYADGAVHLYDLTSMKLHKQIDLDLSMTIAPYDLDGDNYIQRYQLRNGIGADQDGKFVTVLSPDRLRLNLVDPYTLEVIRSTPKTNIPFTTLDVSKDGKMVAGVDEANRILIYYATTGTRKLAIQAEQVYRISMILFSPDGSQIASMSGGYLAELYIYDTKTGNKVHTLSGYNTMSYSPDGKTLVSDNIDYGIYVWDAVNGKKLASPAADWIYDVAFSPDGKTIAIAGVEVHQMTKDRQNVISFFDPGTYQMQTQKLNGQPAILSKLRYSPDGTMLASVDAHGNVRIWDAATGEVVKEIRETVPGPVQLAFMANGRTLILGGGDGTLRFYEVR